MWRQSLAAVIVYTTTQTAAAVEIEDCAGIENDLDRLACYDEAAGLTPEVTVTEPPESAWSVRVETSEFTDETSIFLSSASEEEVNCGYGRGGQIVLSIRCLENTTSLILITNCHMASSSYNDYGHVDMRVDDQDARTVRMDESTDNQALGLWSGGRAIPEIQRMFGGQTLVIRMTPYGESAVTARFDITGLEEAIGPLREACHW